MKLCFSLMRDISTNAVCNFAAQKTKNSIIANNHKLSVTFSMQRIPLDRNFEFIPAYSVLKTHGHRKDFDEILSTVERGALHGLIAANRFGLKLHGVRIKLIELQTIDSLDLKSELFRCAFEAIDNGIYSGEIIIAETLDLSVATSERNTEEILFKGISKDNSLYQVTPYQKDKIMAYSTHKGRAATDMLFELGNHSPFSGLKTYKRWMIPLGKRLETIYEEIGESLAKDDLGEFEKWTMQGEFNKKIRLFMEKNPKITQNQHWITEEQFISFVRNLKA